MIFLQVFVSLGFAISGPASNLVESLVFLLVTRPFELGDRVRFDKGDAMYVRRMDLYTTTFERLDGTICTYRNSLLASREVSFLARFGLVCVHVLSLVDFVHHVPKTFPHLTTQFSHINVRMYNINFRRLGMRNAQGSQL